MSMEKYGVTCECAQGQPPKTTTKLASGDKACPECGEVWQKKDTQGEAKREQHENPTLRGPGVRDHRG